MNRQQAIIDLWHLSRTGLAGQSTPATRTERLFWVRNQMKQHYPDLCRVRLEDRDLTDKELWFEVTDILQPFK